MNLEQETMYEVYTVALEMFDKSEYVGTYLGKQKDVEKYFPELNRWGAPARTEESKVSHILLENLIALKEILNLKASPNTSQEKESFEITDPQIVYTFTCQRKRQYCIGDPNIIREFYRNLKGNTPRLKELSIERVNEDKIQEKLSKTKNKEELDNLERKLFD